MSPPTASPDVKKAIDEYLKLNRDRRQILKTDGDSESWIFQPTSSSGQQIPPAD